MDSSRSEQAPHEAWSANSWPREVVLGRSIWHPAAGYGRPVGYAFIAGLLCISVLALLLFVQDSGTIRVVWGILLVAALSGVAGVWHLLRGLSSMRYVLGEDHLRIEWRDVARRIPYDEMLEVTYHLRDRFELPYREPYWPGYRVSSIRTRDGIWHSFATVPPHRRVRITTPVAVFAISPERPVLFIQELERRRMGRSLLVPAEVAASPALITTGTQRRRAAATGAMSSVRQAINVFRDEVLTDSVASTLVAVGIIIPVFLLAYTFNEVDFLPEQIPLRWNAAGEPTLVGGSAAIWTLPLLAVSVLVVNAALATLVIQFDRVAARLLVAITPIVQITVAFAIWRIIN